jgi:hypothetical protein
MLWAVDAEGDEVFPIKGLRAICPLCHTPVTSKMYRVKKPHFAHLSRKDCDPWSEGETGWHLSWKELVRKGFYERVIYPHRADILGNDDTVIELQHSPISGDDIGERERFYGNMVWLLDGVSYFKSAVYGGDGESISFRFQYPRPSHTYFQKPVFAHLHCGKLVEIDRMEPKYIHGKVITWRNFVDRYLSKVIKGEYDTSAYPESIELRNDITFGDYFDTRCLCPEQPVTRYCFSYQREVCDFGPLVDALGQLVEMLRNRILDAHPDFKLKDILLLENRLEKVLPEFELYRELAARGIWDVTTGRTDNDGDMPLPYLEYPFSYAAYRSAGQFEDLVDTPPELLRYSFAYPEHIRFYILFQLLDHPAAGSVMQNLTSDDENEASRAVESFASFIYNGKLCDPPYSFFDIRDDIRKFSKACKERGYIKES